MRFGSVCSGIEAASVAWHPLGWQAAWLAEIEPFPSAVLKHHYPEVPNYGDMTKLPERILSSEIEAPDLFCGGTPCQAFSVAGLRKSLDDARGNLSLTFCEIANAIDHVRSGRREPPCVVFWENVPGVLSTKDNAFGCFLAGLAGEDDPLIPSGGKWTNAGAVFGPARAVAWRILDAQYFGVAQRRRRVFVVASARADFDPAAVLFEFDGLRRDSAPSREAGERTAAGVEERAGGGRWWDGGEVAATITTKSDDQRMPDKANAQLVIQPITFRADAMREGTAKTPSADAEGRVRLRDPGMGMYEDIAPTLDCGAAHGVAQPLAFPANLSGTQCANSENLAPAMGAKNPTAVAFDTTQITSPANYSNPQPGDPCHPLAAGAHPPAVAFAQNQRDEVRVMDVAGALAAEPGAKQQTYLHQAMQVRRLTPTECERLQGFPDGYTAIPWRNKSASECPDGPRYKALGNSWAVPCVRWIGERILRAANDNLPTTKATHVI